MEYDFYEVEILERQNKVAEGTAPTDGDGEENANEETDEDADGASVEVSIPVDPAEQQEIHKRHLQTLHSLLQKNLNHSLDN
jgi:hypothetical protein